MQQFFDSMKNYVNEKASSPLLPAFTLSWCIYNYEVWVYLFSDASPEQKLNGVRSSLKLWSFLGVLETFLLPALIALFYVFAYPSIARRIIKFTEEEKNKTKGAVIEARRDTPRSTPEFNRMKAELEKVKAEKSGEIWELKGKVEAELSRNEELTGRNREYLQDLGQASEHKKQLERELQSAREAVANLETARDESNRTIKDLDLRLTTRNVAFADIERKLDIANSAVIDRNGEIAELTKAIDHFHQQRDETVENIGPLKKHLIAKDEQMSSMDEKIKTLKAKLGELTDERNALNRQLSEYSVRRETQLRDHQKLVELLKDLNELMDFSEGVPDDLRKALLTIKMKYASKDTGVTWRGLKSTRELLRRKDLEDNGL